MIRRAPRARVRRAPDGRWTARLYLGTDRATGRPVRPQRSWPASWDEGRAQAACDEWAAGLAPVAAAGSAKRLGSMLARYVEDPCRGWAGSTLATYRSALANYIGPTLGDVPYDELAPCDVQAAYRILLTDTAARPAISRSTLRKAHYLLKGAYRSWQRQLGRNPMIDVPAPVPERVEPVSLSEWDQDELAAALERETARPAAGPEGIRRRTVAFAAWLALSLGLRCGEACALTRRDWRRSAHDMHVGSTVTEHPRLMRARAPKRGSVGNVAMGEGTEAGLAAHLAWQDGWLERPGGGTPLVTFRADGALVRPSALSRGFTELARELGMPEGTTFHTLRHTHATWLIMNGFDMRTVQERLRHSDVRTTLALYTSVAPGRDADAAAAFAAAMDRDKEG